MRVRFQALCLTEYDPLREVHQVDGVCELRAGLREFRRNPFQEFTRPLKKICAVEFGFQRTEERVVLQPVRLIIAESVVVGTQIGARGRCKVGKVCPGRLEGNPFR